MFKHIKFSFFFFWSVIILYYKYFRNNVYLITNYGKYLPIKYNRDYDDFFRLLWPNTYSERL